jgi:hypothetical protein
MIIESPKNKEVDIQKEKLNVSVPIPVQDQTISMTTHLQLIKWLSILYFFNILVIFVGFLIIWLNK